MDLGAHLAKSRLIIPLWSRNYLHSRWCSLELSHMVAREQDTACRTVSNPFGIIVPTIIHDGENIPNSIGHVQRLETVNCFNVRMRRDSQRAEQLDAILSSNSESIAKSINSAPEFLDEWPGNAANEFFEEFHRSATPTQTTTPLFT